MRDDKLEKLFAQTENIAASDAAKANAIKAAMTEFQTANSEITEQMVEEVAKPKTFFQGFITWLRPMVGTTTQSRSTTMKPIHPKWQYAGIASTCVLAVAVMIAYQKPEQAFNDPRLISYDDGVNSGELEEIIVTATKREQGGADINADSGAPTDLPELLGMMKAAKIKEAQATWQREDLRAISEFKKAGEAQRVRLPIVNRPQANSLNDMSVAPGFTEKGRDRFEAIDQNPIKSTLLEPISTFSVDVDTASYSFVRRQLNQGVLPQKDAVRIEEMVNYFDYTYPAPESKEAPFSTSLKVIDSPWKAGNKLIHVGIKGYQLAPEAIPKSNLVFLLDVSGSMNSPDKLPLVKQSMELLLSQLQPEDTVAIAVYAGAAGTVLEPTPVKEKAKILQALNRLRAGGSTAGGQGLKLAYQLAERNFDKTAVNRIILATDGDFNVGITNRDELKGFVERKREQGIFLSVLGFGQGNYHDQMMQTLAQNGNGVAAYIDTLSEAQKVLVHQATSTLFTIAKDVKIQMEFNPSTVKEYRLLGYETRHLEMEDFNNDKVDAGDIGAGHTVTAIYEITPVDADSGLLSDSRYGKVSKRVDGKQNEYGFLKLRYKLPGESESKLISQAVSIESTEPSQEANFATAVAGFAQLLKGGQYTDRWSYDDALVLAQQNKGQDLYGYRTEFVQLVRKAKIASKM